MSCHTSLFSSMRVLLRGFLWSLCLVVFVACSSVKKTALPVSQAEVSEPSHVESASLRYFFHEASRQKMLGHHSAAFDLFRHCLELDPHSPDVLYELSLYRMALGQDSIGMADLCEAVERAPRNTHFRQALAAFYLEQRKTEEALHHLERLSQLQPRRSDVLMQMVNLYEAQGAHEEAIRTLDRIETLEGKIPSVSFRKFGLYKEMGQEKRAFAALEALCKEYPHEMSYRLAIGNQYLAMNRPDDARKVFEAVRKLEPENTQLKLSLLGYYRQTGADSLYVHQRDSLLFGPSTGSAMRASVMRDYVSEEMSAPSPNRERVEQLFAHLFERFPQELEMAQLRAAFLATYDKRNDSLFVEAMDRVLELEPENTQALFFLIQYYAEHQDFHRLEQLCRRAVLTHPDELLCHFYLGMACYQLDRKEDALEAFHAGIRQKTPESRPTMVAELYSIMGDLLHEEGHETEAYAAYDSCLVYDENHVNCLNNYAYYLSLQERDLDRAEEMSFRAIRKEPANKTYLDTYAWVLFVKGEYAKAARYMDIIVPPSASDSTLLADDHLSGAVIEHAGDIAACNGNIEQALRFWLLAQQAGGNGLTPMLPKKIKMKKYIR